MSHVTGGISQKVRGQPATVSSQNMSVVVGVGSQLCKCEISL